MNEWKKHYFSFLKIWGKCEENMILVLAIYML